MSVFPLLQATKCGCFGQHRHCTIEETTLKKHILLNVSLLLQLKR